MFFREVILKLEQSEFNYHTDNYMYILTSHSFILLFVFLLPQLISIFVLIVDSVDSFYLQIQRVTLVTHTALTNNNWGANSINNA